MLKNWANAVPPLISPTFLRKECLEIEKMIFFKKLLNIHEDQIKKFNLIILQKIWILSRII